MNWSARGSTRYDPDVTPCHVIRAAALPLLRLVRDRLSTALKILIGLNVAVFLLSQFLPESSLRCSDWSPPSSSASFGSGSSSPTCSCTAGLFHILFNMLALWMFGTELERLWGTRYLPEVLLRHRRRRRRRSRCCFRFCRSGSRSSCSISIIGASGAIYGLLLAYALYFPDRPIYMYFVFPIPARIFVLIMGAIALLASLSETGGGVANATHLGGLLVGYLYLKGAPGPTRSPS